MVAQQHWMVKYAKKDALPKHCPACQSVNLLPTEWKSPRPGWQCQDCSMLVYRSKRDRDRDAKRQQEQQAREMRKAITPTEVKPPKVESKKMSRPKKYAAVPPASIHRTWVRRGIAPYMGYALRKIAEGGQCENSGDESPATELATMLLIHGPKHEWLSQLGQELHNENHPYADKFNWDRAAKGIAVDTDVANARAANRGMLFWPHRMDIVRKHYPEVSEDELENLVHDNHMRQVRTGLDYLPRNDQQFEEHFKGLVVPHYQVRHGGEEATGDLHPSLKYSRKPPEAGETDEHGNIHEPQEEPRLGQFIANQFKANYGESPVMTTETGFLLRSGHPVQMGMGGVRGEDHRGAIPSEEAMIRWGWPQDIIKQHSEGTRTPALIELMRRSGAARVHGDRHTLMVHHESPLSNAQKEAIALYVGMHQPKTVLFQHPQDRQAEFDSPTAEEIADYLHRGIMGHKQYGRIVASATNPKRYAAQQKPSYHLTAVVGSEPPEIHDSLVDALHSDAKRMKEQGNNYDKYIFVHYPDSSFRQDGHGQNRWFRGNPSYIDKRGVQRVRNRSRYTSRIQPFESDEQASGARPDDRQLEVERLVRDAYEKAGGYDFYSQHPQALSLLKSVENSQSSVPLNGLADYMEENGIDPSPIHEIIGNNKHLYSRKYAKSTGPFNPAPVDPNMDISHRETDPLWMYHQGKMDYAGNLQGSPQFWGDKPEARSVIHRTQTGGWNNPATATPPEGMMTHQEAADLIQNGHESTDFDLMGTNRGDTDPQTHPFGTQHPYFEFHGKHGKGWNAIFPLQDLISYGKHGDPYRILAGAVRSGNRHAIPLLVQKLKERDNPGGWWKGWSDLHRDLERSGDLTPETVLHRATRLATETRPLSADPERHWGILQGAIDSAQKGDFSGFGALADHMEENGVPKHYADLMRAELANVNPSFARKGKGNRRFQRKYAKFPSDRAMHGSLKPVKTQTNNNVFTYESNPSILRRMIGTPKGTFYVKQLGHGKVWNDSAKQAAKNEMLVGSLKRSLGLKAPETRVGEMNGIQHLVSRGINGQSSVDVSHIPQLERDKHVLADYLTGSHDRHLGNYVVSPEGLHSIDHEKAFDATPSNALSLANHGLVQGAKGFRRQDLPDDVYQGENAKKYTLHPEAIDHALANATKFLTAAQASGKHEFVPHVQRRLKALEALRRSGNTSIDNLHRIEQSFKSPLERNSRKRRKYARLDQRAIDSYFKEHEQQGGGGQHPILQDMLMDADDPRHHIVAKHNEGPVTTQYFQAESPMGTHPGSGNEENLPEMMVINKKEGRGKPVKAVRLSMVIPHANDPELLAKNPPAGYLQDWRRRALEMEEVGENPEDPPTFHPLNLYKKFTGDFHDPHEVKQVIRDFQRFYGAHNQEHPYWGYLKRMADVLKHHFPEVAEPKPEVEDPKADPQLFRRSLAKC